MGVGGLRAQTGFGAWAAFLLARCQSRQTDTRPNPRRVLINCDKVAKAGLIECGRPHQTRDSNEDIDEYPQRNDR